MRLEGPDVQENQEDEANILSDQDETSMTDLDANDENIGSDGTTNFALDDAAFARGEVDLSRQMARSMRRADHLSHRDQEVREPDQGEEPKIQEPDEPEITEPKEPKFARDRQNDNLSRQNSPSSAV